MDYNPGVQAQASAIHAASLDEQLPRESSLAVEAVTLNVGLVDFLLSSPIEAEANTLAAWLGFRRAVEQLRVGHFVAYLGHYSEVPLLLRGAYESAGMARHLAHDPEAADRWVQDGVWHPDRAVRRWIEENGGDAEISRLFYRHASDVAHTTWASTAPFFTELDRAFPICVNPFDRDFAQQALLGVVGAGLFVAHCVRNAAVDESIIPIDLQQRIIALHAEAGGDTDHLERNWEEVARRQEVIRERVNRATGLDERIAADPLSVWNLTRNEDHDET